MERYYTTLYQRKEEDIRSESYDFILIRKISCGEMLKDYNKLATRKHMEVTLMDNGKLQ